MEDLIKNVEYFIRKDELKKKCRKRKYIHKRIFFFHTLRNAGLTYQRIAEMFELNHATVIHGINTYKNLKRTKDELLLLDIADYDGKFKFHKKTYDLKKDILKATTIRDLDKIKSRTSNNLYKELI
jgi:histidyl-tRNA synthetase